MSPRRVHGAFCTGLTWAVKLTMPPLGSICRIMPTAIKTTSTFQRFQHTDSEWFRMIQNHLENGAFFYLWNLWSVRSHSVVMLLDATCNSAVSYRKCSKCSNTWSADLRSEKKNFLTTHSSSCPQLVPPLTATPWVVTPPAVACRSVHFSMLNSCRKFEKNRKCPMKRECLKRILNVS